MGNKWRQVDVWSHHGSHCTGRLQPASHISTWEAMHNNHLTNPNRLLNPLLDLIVNMQLEMALPQDTPTLESCNTGNWTWPDNIWRNADSPSPFISCSVNPTIWPAYTNHLPIVSVIDLTYILSKHIERFNYKSVNWKTYREILENNLTEMATLLTSPIERLCTIKTATNLLFKSINKTTRQVVPLIKITPHMKCWGPKNWCYYVNLGTEQTLNTTDGTASLITQATYTTKRQADNSQEQSKKPRWTTGKNGLIMQAVRIYGPLTDTWRNPTDYRWQWVPALKKPDRTSMTTNNQKAEQLANTFFPLERPLRQHKHQFTKTNPPTARQSKFPSFTPERVANTLTKVNPHKVPGPLGISNTILKHCAQLLTSHLAVIYTTICKLKHYLSKFHKIHQVVLPKPGWVSYKIPSSYRLITLIETLAKVQSTIVTEGTSCTNARHTTSYWTTNLEAAWATQPPTHCTTWNNSHETLGERDRWPQHYSLIFRQHSQTCKRISSL